MHAYGLPLSEHAYRLLLLTLNIRRFIYELHAYGLVVCVLLLLLLRLARCEMTIDMKYTRPTMKDGLCSAPLIPAADTL